MTDEERIRASLARIDVLIDLRRFPEAIAAVSEALASHPEDERLWSRLAVTHLYRGEFESTLEAASRAIALNPSSAWPHRIRSTACVELRRYRDALESAREAVKLTPQMWQSHLCLATAYLHALPNRSLARLEAQRAVALGPNVAETHVTLGMIELAERNSSEAQAAFRRALEIDPQNWVAHNAMATSNLRETSLIKRSDALAEATVGFATALRSNPRESSSRRILEFAVQRSLWRSEGLVFLIALFSAVILAKGHSIVVRVVPGLLLLIPSGVFVQYVRRLPPGLRRTVRLYVRRSPTIVTAIVLAIGSGGLIISSAISRTSARHVLLLIAAVVALVACLVQLLAFRLTQTGQRRSDHFGASGGEKPLSTTKWRAERSYANPFAVHMGYLAVLLGTFVLVAAVALLLAVFLSPLDDRLVSGAVALLTFAAIWRLALAIHRRRGHLSRRSRRPA